MVSQYHRCTVLLISLLFLSSAVLPKVEAHLYGLHLKKLAALAILSRALKPDLVPVPVPVPVESKQVIPKPVLVPVPIHHYHTVKGGHHGGYGKGKGQVIYTDTKIGGGYGGGYGGVYGGGYGGYY